MKVVEIEGAFGLDNLVVGERPEPQPGPGEVKLRMKAASLNYRDLLMVRGLYNPNLSLPLIPGSDGVGEVVEVGPGVSRVGIGDRVAATFFQGWFGGPPTREGVATTLGGPLDGVLSEYRVLGEQGVVRLPEHLTDEQAATLPCAALTSWSALVTYGRVRPGDSVLIQGTGGVSLFGLQFAKMMGAEVIAISGSDEKLQRVLEMGADHGINYRETPRWGKAVRERTAGHGVDHIIEVGGAGTLEQSLQCIRLGGHISLIGVLAGSAKEFNILPIVMRNICVQGIFVGTREGFEEMNRAVAHHRLIPVVDRVFPMDSIREALELMKGGGHFGKICITIG